LSATDSGHDRCAVISQNSSVITASLYWPAGGLAAAAAAGCCSCSAAEPYSSVAKSPSTGSAAGWPPVA